MLSRSAKGGCGGLVVLDINEEMPRDGVAIHSDYAIDFPHGRFKGLLRIMAVASCQHEGDAFVRLAGRSGGVRQNSGRADGCEAQDDG